MEKYFVSNNTKLNRKVLTSINHELEHCEEFALSVTFITDGGFVSLAQTFKDLEARNVKGKILTTDYLAFSDPDALDKINEFNNFA